MKLDKFDIPRDKVEIQARRQVEHEFKLIGSARHTPGLTLYAVNLKTGDIHPAEFVKESTISFMDAHKPVNRRKVQVEKDCIYIEALNIKSANAKVIKAYMRAYKRSMDDIK